MAKQKLKPAGGLGRFNLLALLCTLLGVALGAGLLYLQVTRGANNVHNEKIERQQAKAIAALLDSRYLDMQATLTLHANNPAMAAALTNPAAEARSAAAAELQNAIPYAVRVELIPTGSARVDLSATVPINFAALDLIRRAEAQPFVGPEAGAKPRDVIYAAAPVTSNTGVAGVLFVAYSADYLNTAIAGLGDQLGFARIEQQVDNAAPAVVLEYGTPTGALLATTEQLKAPAWTLKYNTASAASVTSPVDLALPLAAILALGLGGIWLAFSRLSTAMHSDSEALGQYGSKVLSGHVGATDHFQIDVFQKLATSLGQALGDAPGAAQPRRSSAKSAAKAADDSARQQIAAKPAANLRNDRAKSANAEAKAAAAAAAAGAALLTANASEEDDAAEDDDFLDIGDDDDFSNVTDAQVTGSFMQANLPEVDEGNWEEEAAVDSKDDFAAALSDDLSDDLSDELDVAETPPLGPAAPLDPEIFRAYDIRGIVDTNLTPEAVYWIGRAFASQARSEDQTRTAVGRDGRLSSPKLAQELVRGLLDGGMDVVDIGQVATPMLYFATHKLNTGTGIMITGSHNPPEYNGLKMMIGGETLAEARIQQLRQRLQEQNIDTNVTAGELAAVVIDTDYMDRILDDVAVAQSLKVVVDCGNGVAGGIAPLVLQELGCEVIPLYCEVDGTFPNHHPDPADPRNMQDLITVVKAENADVGIAFDGDGDRIGLVSNTGEIIWPDKLMMLFARDIVGRNPGADIIYDVKCSRHLNNVISEYGGRPIMWKTGHSHMKAKLKETGALLAGEFSGHVAFGERWYGFDDAIYTAARFLEIAGSSTDTTAELFESFPATEATPELQIETTDAAKFDIINKLAASADFGEGTVTSIDGVRVDYPNGWGLIRASNTSPKLTLRFEADTTTALAEVKDRFRSELAKVDSSLRFT